MYKMIAQILKYKILFPLHGMKVRTGFNKPFNTIQLNQKLTKSFRHSITDDGNIVQVDIVDGDMMSKVATKKQRYLIRRKIEQQQVDDNYGDFYNLDLRAQRRLIEKYEREHKPTLQISSFKTANIQSDTNDVNLINKGKNNIMRQKGYDFISNNNDLEIQNCNRRLQDDIKRPQHEDEALQRQIQRLQHQFNKETAHRVFKKHEERTARVYQRMNGLATADEISEGEREQS